MAKLVDLVDLSWRAIFKVVKHREMSGFIGHIFDIRSNL